MYVGIIDEEMGFKEREWVKRGIEKLEVLIGYWGNKFGMLEGSMEGWLREFYMLEV